MSRGQMNNTESERASLIMLRGKTTSASQQEMLMEESRHFERLFVALDQAGIAMNQALTGETIFSSMVQVLKQLGFSCILWLADQSQSRLSSLYLSQGDRATRAAEKLTGFRKKDFSVSIESVDLLKQVVKEQHTVFVMDSTEVVRQILPQSLRNRAQTIVNIFKAPKAINAPLRVKDKAIGLFSVQSNDLTEKDIPAINAFANQFSAAWHIVQLYDQTQQEIARRKQAEEILRQREREFHILVENSPDAVARLDREGHYQYVNPARARHFELPVSEIQGKTWQDLLGQKEMEKGKFLDAVRKQMFEVSKEYTFEHRANTPEGLRWMESQGVPELAEDGSVESVLIVTRDITKRKATEEALAASRAYADSIIQNFLDTLIMVDEEAKIQTVNPATCRLLGYTEEELKGQPASMFFAEEEEEEEEVRRVFQFFRGAEKEKIPHPKDIIRNRILTYKAKDGRLIPMSFNASMLTDEAGNVIGALAGAKDITEIKQAEEAKRIIEEKFRNSIENIFKFVPEGLLVLTDKLNVFKRNKALDDLVHQYAEKLGYTESELADIITEQVKIRVASGEKSVIVIPQRQQ